MNNPYAEVIERDY